MEKLLKILYLGSSQENIAILTAHTSISIFVVENTLKAVNFLKSDRITDAIICENILPGGDGFSMFEWVRSRPKFNAIPFILVSERFREDLYQNAFRKHIDDYYVTPLPKAESLISRIRFLMEFRNKTNISFQ